MKVLIGCECSGNVRREFRALGHDAWSCDLQPADDGSPHHYQMDVFEAIKQQAWDLAVFHPPCTYLTVSGNKWMVGNPERWHLQLEASLFVWKLWNADIPKIALENPVGVLSSRLGKPTQIIQPWQFGHGETKATCLWLKGLPPLTPTNIVEGREQRLHKLPPSKDRAKIRSITYPGIAKAMAEQWGGSRMLRRGRLGWALSLASAGPHHYHPSLCRRVGRTSKEGG